MRKHRVSWEPDVFDRWQQGTQKIGESRSERAGPENGPKHHRGTKFNYE